MGIFSGGDNGGTSGGPPLTTTQENTLEHLIYNPTSDRLEADREIQGTLNSFLLGRQWSMTSGARQMFFKNLSSNINFYPAWGGVKDQSILANQDATGLIPMAATVYSDDTIGSEGNGAADVSGAVPFRVEINSVFSSAVYSIELIVEEEILATDFIFVDAWDGTDATGIQIYSQKFTGILATIGTQIKLDSTQSLDSITGDVSYIEISKSSSREGAQSLLQVRRGLTDITVPYRKFNLRTFINEPVALGKDLHDPDKIISSDGLKNLTITDTTLKYNDGVTNRFDFDGTIGKIFSPGSTTEYMKVNATSVGFVFDGSNALTINNTSAKLTSKDGNNFIRLKNASVAIHQGGQERLWMDNVSSDIRSPNQSNQLRILNTEIFLEYATVNRLSVNATTSKIASPDNLQNLTVDNTGAFYNGSEILTNVDLGVTVAPLSGGLIPEVHLPSFVDDIIEGFLDVGDTRSNGFDSFYTDIGLTTIIVGVASKIYVDLNTNQAYRWSGTANIQIATGLVLGELSTNAYRGDRGKIAFDHSQTPHDFSPTIHSHETIISPDLLKNLTIRNSDLIYNDGTRDRLGVTGVTAFMVSPDGTNTSIVDDFGLRYTIGAFDRLTVNLTATSLLDPSGINRVEVNAAANVSRSPNQLQMLEVNNFGVLITDTTITPSGTVTRFRVADTFTNMVSPNNLESLQVDDTGAFYNTKQLLTESSGVQQPVSRTSVDNGVAKFVGTDSGRIESSTTVKITDNDILEFDNSRLIATSILTAQNEDNMVDVLTADLSIVVPIDVTTFTVRDLNNNIGTFNVRIVFIDGTDELTLTRGNDNVEVNKIGGVWYFYNFRNGTGGRITT